MDSPERIRHDSDILLEGCKSFGSDSRSSSLSLKHVHKGLNSKLESVMSETTRASYHRRRIILDALINNHKPSMDKLQTILNDGDEEENASSSAGKISLPMSQPSTFSPHKDSPKFLPKWENYDVMKHRWSFILPQTKRLNSEDRQVLPQTSCSRTVTMSCSDGTKRVLNGYYNDIEKFDSLHSR